MTTKRSPAGTTECLEEALVGIALSDEQRDRLGLVRLARDWERIAGAALARRSTLVSLRDGVLRVSCHGAAWVRSASALAPEIPSRAATLPGVPHLRRVEVVEDRRRAPPTRPRPGPTAAPLVSEPARAMAAGISDPRRRAIAERVLTLALQRSWGDPPPR